MSLGRTSRPTTDLLKTGGELLQQSGMKAFADRYRKWAQVGGEFELDAESVDMSNVLSIGLDEDTDMEI